MLRGHSMLSFKKMPGQLFVGLLLIVSILYLANDGLLRTHR